MLSDSEVEKHQQLRVYFNKLQNSPTHFINEAHKKGVVLLRMLIQTKGVNGMQVAA